MSASHGDGGCASRRVPFGSRAFNGYRPPRTVRRAVTSNRIRNDGGCLGVAGKTREIKTVERRNNEDTVEKTSRERGEPRNKWSDVIRGDTRQRGLD